MKGNIILAHGSGGRLTRELVEGIFVARFGGSELPRLSDAATFRTLAGRLAFTTDSFVIKPLFFPGGDIGKLAVCGTVNDLAVSGARPEHLSCGMVIEEGFPLADLDRIACSMAMAAKQAGARIVAGDTKVVENGAADGIFINTAGVGRVSPKARLGPEFARPGDAVIITGTVGDHGMAITALRKGLKFDTDIESDCAPLNGMLAPLVEKLGGEVRFMRDATRGGLAAVLNELADGRPWGISLEEADIPVAEQVRAICELLGFDPLYVANEGKAVAVVSARCADKAVGILRRSPLGRKAAVIGEIIKGGKGMVRLRTAIGGERIIDMPVGDQLPRIC